MTLRRSSSGSRAFTLIELLAVVSVMAVLVVMLGRIVGMVSDTWLAGKARVDNFAQARIALGLMTRDLESMVLRKDVPAFVDAAGGGSAFAFYARVQGSEGDRKVSLVDYRLLEAGTAPRLVRANYGLDYGSLTPKRTVRFGNTTSLPEIDEARIQELADGVLRLEWQFVAGDGSLQEDFVFDHDNRAAGANTPAIRVSLAVLDTEAYRLARATNSLAALLSSLDGIPAAGQSYASYWSQKADSGNFSSGTPKPVLRALRFYDQTIALPIQ